MSLSNKAAKGVYWTSIDRITTMFSGIVVNILLARLLMPKDFGMVAMLAVFLAVSSAFLDSGFSQALIRKNDATDIDYTSVFYINFFIGISVYTLLYFLAPLVSVFYNEPALTDLSRALFFVLIINAFSLVHTAILIKSFNFKGLAKANILSTIISGLVGVGFAFWGFGVWALVFQSLLHASVRAILIWWNSSWRPSKNFSLRSIKELFSFGSKLLVSGIIYQIFNNVYTLFIGKFLDPLSVGYYAQANKLQQIPASNMDSIIQSVTYPILSEVQGDDSRLRMGFKKTLKQTTYFSFPIMILFSIIADPFVELFLSAKWLPSVDILQLLCFSGMIYPLHTINLNILKVKGRSDLFLLLEVIKNSLSLIVLIITVFFGLYFIVIGQVIFSYIGYFLNSSFSHKLLNYGVIKQIKDFSPNLLLAIISGMLCYSATLLIEDRFILIFTQISVYLIIYFGISLYLKKEEFVILKTIISERFFSHG